jgi:hypothetical protein
MRKRHAIVRVPGILVRTVDEEAFLIDPDADSIHHMNRIGLAVWRLIEKPMTRREIAALLVAAFPETPPQQISADLGRLFKLLLDERLAKRR